MSQARYWLLTIPASDWSFPDQLPQRVVYMIGQLEQGSTTGYLHYQILVHFNRAVRGAFIKKTFTRSTNHELCNGSLEQCETYVTKDDTRVDGPWALGEPLKQRNNPNDWKEIYESAKCGNYDVIPHDILIRSYSQIRRITQDNLQPVAIQREVFVFWGTTGAGKSHKAWTDASFNAYPKDPRTKFWDGYQGQEHVVIDEFRGGIDIAHMLRWCDQYPVIIEVKGSSTVLKATKIWITSNLDPRQWYPDIDAETRNALLRRLTITHFSTPYANMIQNQ